MTPTIKNGFWSALGRTVSTVAMLVVVTAIFSQLERLADARALQIADYDVAHPGILPGWTLIAGGLLPIITYIFYFAACAAIVWRFRAKK